jgi:hypothetical protein
MNKCLYVVCFLIACLILPTAAWADVYDFRYFTGASYSTSDTIYATGTLTVTPQGGTEYLITGISGTRNGQTITALEPAGVLWDDTHVDNLIFFEPPAPISPATFTPSTGSDDLANAVSGFAFETADGMFQAWTIQGQYYGNCPGNQCYGPFTPAPNQYEYKIGSFLPGYGYSYNVPQATFPGPAITFEVWVPEPTAAVLLSVMLLGVAGLLRKKHT